MYVQSIDKAERFSASLYKCVVKMYCKHFLTIYLNIQMCLKASFFLCICVQRCICFCICRYICKQLFSLCICSSRCICKPIFRCDSISKHLPLPVGQWVIDSFRQLSHLPSLQNHFLQQQKVWWARNPRRGSIKKTFICSLSGADPPPTCSQIVVCSQQTREHFKMGKD